MELGNCIFWMFVMVIGGIAIFNDDLSMSVSGKPNPIQPSPKPDRFKRKRTHVWQGINQIQRLQFVPSDGLTGYVSGMFRNRSLRMYALLGTTTRITISTQRKPAIRSQIQTRIDRNIPLSLQEIQALLPGKAQNLFSRHDLSFTYLEGVALTKSGIVDDFERLEAIFHEMSKAAEAVEQIMCLGSLAIPGLAHIVKTRGTMYRLAYGLCRSISLKTQKALKWKADNLYCTFCYDKPVPYTITFNDEGPLTYWGCRTCGQSTQFIHHKTDVVSVLDDKMIETHLVQDTQLRINWLKHRQICFSDRVEIISASDEDVERFAVQLGNDTNPDRRANRQTMPCLIHPTCHLSSNTFRILERQFEKIETI